MISFSLTKEQETKVKIWLEEQEQIACAMQRKELQDPEGNETYKNAFVADMIENGYAYYGAAGGAVTYKFTPTGIGVGLTVVHDFTKNEIDLTDYENW